MPVSAEEMIFRPGPENTVSTQQATVGWPVDAENDPVTPPLSRVSELTNNPYTEEPIMARERDDGTVPADAMDFEEGDDDSVTTKVGTVGWPDGAENAPNTGPGADEPEAEPKTEAE